jgi:hypothetical protein
MSGDEYLLFAQDPNQFIRLMFKRKYPKLSANELSDSISKYMTFGQYAMKVTKKMSEKYSRPTVFEMMSALLMPIEFFNSVGRGIKGLSIDARKHKSELIEALNAYYDIITQPSIDAALKKDNTDYVTDCYTALLAYSTLSVGQFEELYWPHLKKYLDQVIAANKTIYIYCESTMERFCEYFQDYPKGHIVMHLELDDPIQIRKKLPNVCLAGGMTTDLLGHGTSQQCIDKAKMLIDSLGSGYMMSQNKMMSFKNDCKRENLLALNEFLRNYR